MSAPKLRADQLLVARGLSPTRAKAQAAIAAGGVFADGQLVHKASQSLPMDCQLRCEPASAWVSRAGEKLELAMRDLGLSAQGAHCLDIGASTGGFTQVLLAQGAASVTSVDVGKDQLHPIVRADPRVRSFEGLDARALLPRHLVDAPALIVCDASFIAAHKVLGPALALAAAEAQALILIKPQYEAGAGKRANDANCAAIAAGAGAQLDGLEGFGLRHLMPSKVRGAEGSQEFFALLAKNRAVRA